MKRTATLLSLHRINTILRRNCRAVSQKLSGIPIFTTTATQIRIVPADYELTDADKAAKANGDLVFSYGSAEVELNEIQSATFVKDGMQYQLLQINGKLSGDELVKMAEELVKMAEELVA